MLDEIRWKDELLALVIHSSFSPDGVNFVTPETTSLQVGILKHPAGHVIKSHQHKKCLRTISETPEVLYVVYGKIQAFFYIEDKAVLDRFLLSGDTIILLKGGHGFNILEDSKILEVKQGPYEGVTRDKELIIND